MGRLPVEAKAESRPKAVPRVNSLRIPPVPATNSPGILSTRNTNANIARYESAFPTAPPRFCATRRLGTRVLGLKTAIGILQKTQEQPETSQDRSKHPPNKSPRPAVAAAKRVVPASPATSRRGHAAGSSRNRSPSNCVIGQPSPVPEAREEDVAARPRRRIGRSPYSLRFARSPSRIVLERRR
jgi:hypothetical protein